MEGVGHWLKCKNWGKYALSWALKCTSQQECQCSDDAVCKERRCKLCCENFGLDWTHTAESDKLWEGDIVAALSVIQMSFQYWHFWRYSNIAIYLSILMSIVFFKFPGWYWCWFVKISFYVGIDTSALAKNAGKICQISAVAFNIKIVKTPLLMSIWNMDIPLYIGKCLKLLALIFLKKGNILAGRCLSVFHISLTPIFP